MNVFEYQVIYVSIVGSSVARNLRCTRWSRFRPVLHSGGDIVEEREESRRRMDASYRQMMANYAAQRASLADKPAWTHPRRGGARAPSELTVTHVNQTKDLFVSVVPSRCRAMSRSVLHWTILCTTTSLPNPDEHRIIDALVLYIVNIN